MYNPRRATDNNQEQSVAVIMLVHRDIAIFPKIKSALILELLRMQLDDF